MSQEDYPKSLRCLQVNSGEEEKGNLRMIDEEVLFDEERS
jgi:hypothetical protein